VLCIGASTASAHPLGNFTINHYAGLQLQPDQIGVDFVLDMAEIPAFQEIRGLDTNQNRQPDPQETVQYPASQCEQIAAQLQLTVGGADLPLRLDRSAVEFPPGVGGLLTLRLSCQFQSPVHLPQTETLIQFADHAYDHRLGWREITVSAAGIPLPGRVSSTSISNRLRDYPTDLLSSPPTQRQIEFAIHPNHGPVTPRQTQVTAATASEASLTSDITGRQNDAFTQLISLPDLTPSTIVIALLIAFVWGGFHALSPGHGKTVVGAYLVGSRGTAQHALFLGLTTTITHTAGIFALGLVALFASRFVVTEQIFPWLSVISGVLVVGIGVNLFINRLKGEKPHQHTHGDHDHHEHDHHEHHYHDHPHHDHHHASHHAADGHAAHDPSHALQHAHADHHLPHSQDHTHHSHDHPHSHSHWPPGADGSPVTWSSLLALGISGGLMPCPSALVVILSAIALGRIGFGLALVTAFSLGLAGVLTGVGLILVYARQWFETLPWQAPKIRLLPAMSALLMALIGLGITTQALLQIGAS
jgi:ABC-type nickel/cobalt efflux system permease component RcnA